MNNPYSEMPDKRDIRRDSIYTSLRRTGYWAPAPTERAASRARPRKSVPAARLGSWRFSDHEAYKEHIYCWSLFYIPVKYQSIWYIATGIPSVSSNARMNLSRRIAEVGGTETPKVCLDECLPATTSEPSIPWLSHPQTFGHSN